MIEEKEAYGWFSNRKSADNYIIEKLSKKGGIYIVQKAKSMPRFFIIRLD